MQDFGDDEYPNMICVEAGHVSAPVILLPGTAFEATQVLQVMWVLTTIIQIQFKSATQSSTTDLQSLPDRWPQPKCTFRWLRPDGFNCASSCYRLIWRHAECAIYQPNRKSIGQLLAAVSFPLYFAFWHLHALTLSFLLSFAHSTTGEKNNNNSRKFARWRDTSNHFGHLLILFIGKESTILPTDFIFFSLFSIHSTFVPFFFSISPILPGSNLNFSSKLCPFAFYGIFTISVMGDNDADLTFNFFSICPHLPYISLHCNLIVSIESGTAVFRGTTSVFLPKFSVECSHGLQGLRRITFFQTV